MFFKKNIDDFESNRGKIEGFTSKGLINGICGDRMEMYIKVEDNKITEASYETDGCISSCIAGSMAVKLSKNKMLHEVLAISPFKVFKEISFHKAASVHCSILAVSTLHQAVAAHLLNHQEKK